MMPPAIRATIVTMVRMAEHWPSITRPSVLLLIRPAVEAGLFENLPRSLSHAPSRRRAVEDDEGLGTGAVVPHPRAHRRHQVPVHVDRELVGAAYRENEQEAPHEADDLMKVA